MITLKTLITIAPFSPEMKEKLITSLPTLSEGKTRELEELCWSLIEQDYDLKVQIAQEKELMEVGLHKKDYSKEDMDKIEETVYAELAKKLQESDEEGSITEVREKIEEMKADKDNNPSQN